MIAKNPKVIMTSSQFVERLKVLASRKTYYKNKWKDNCCLVHADGRTSADCVCLIKSVLNNYNVYNNTPGYYQKDFSNTGDCTEIELLNQCSQVTADFGNMGNKPRILWMNSPNSHVGVYLGEEVTIAGKVYNVIECCSIWKGIVYSYVDADGTRRKYRGGTKSCRWMKNGLPDKWVSFNATEQPTSNEKPKVDYSTYPVLKMVIEKKTGRYLTRGEYVKILQGLLLTKGYDSKGIDGVFGKDTKSAVENFQRNNTDIYGKKLVVDGCVGQKTWGSLYK